MGKIKEQLAGVAALIGVLAAIGGGFVKYGEITTKLDALESANVKDFSAEIAVLQEQVDALGTEHSHTKTLVNEKQIEILKTQIEELKLSSSNPLAQ
jgi:outer membrane murein-binding lipoprotein Lpp|tara:strand:- start:383 stop:673 length:291 start_codon:yes stop_codon:yes gene_type:complete